MARYDDPNSATSQFFINLQDNSHLDPPPGGFGYAVFGKVIEGMDVVNAIRQGDKMIKLTLAEG
jgi:peptidyl-prolyl cis-trans isomerase A (cyclophilin A)